MWDSAVRGASWSDWPVWWCRWCFVLLAPSTSAFHSAPRCHSLDRESGGDHTDRGHDCPMMNCLHRFGQSLAPEWRTLAVHPPGDVRRSVRTNFGLVVIGMAVCSALTTP